MDSVCFGIKQFSRRETMNDGSQKEGDGSSNISISNHLKQSSWFDESFLDTDSVIERSMKLMDEGRSKAKIHVMSVHR